MVWKITSEQAAKIAELARSTCCNYDEGRCLRLDDTCVQLLGQYGISCKYFRDAVLPNDRALYRAIKESNGQKEECM